jgi:hypothetical protein
MENRKDRGPEWVQEMIDMGFNLEDTLITFDGIAMAMRTREAWEALIASRPDDPEFQERVRRRFHEAREQARVGLEEIGDAEELIDAMYAEGER